MSASSDWTHRPAPFTADPLFGARRQWLAYSFETTGYGSVERCGSAPHRVTIVHPDDDRALQQHHHLVRRGRLAPALHLRRIDATSVHVIDRDELVRTGADGRGSWLSGTQDIARLCATDNDVSRLVGPALRQLLWFGREHVGSQHVAGALAELRQAAEALAAEREHYIAALVRLVQDDIRSIRLETETMAQMRREWGFS